VRDKATATKRQRERQWRRQTDGKRKSRYRGGKEETKRKTEERNRIERRD
jgi:hypothetical protein